MSSYDKKNLVNINSPIFNIARAHNLKTLTGVEKSENNKVKPPFQPDSIATTKIVG